MAEDNQLEGIVPQEQVLITGDFHQHLHYCQQSQVSSHVEVRTQQALLQDNLRAKARIVAGQTQYKPVHLEVIEIRRGSDTGEDFGESGIFSTFQVRHPAFVFEVEIADLFQEAYGTAENEASKTDQTSESQREFASKRGNLVGVIGSAGVGKTTFGKMVVAHHLEQVEQADDFFMFYLPCRDVNFGETTTVFQFLAQFCVPNWDFEHASSKNILQAISRSAHAFLIIDGLDEARMDDVSASFHTMTLLSKARADRILMNLLSGHILPNVKKLVTSRPGIYHMLLPEYKPLFTVRVIGLTEESQRDLVNTVCRRHNREHDHALRLLSNSPTIKALCYNPMFCIMTAKCILTRREDDVSPITITQVFASALEDCVRNKEKFFRLGENVENLLENLSRLALSGIHEHQIAFGHADMQRYNISDRAVETFLNIGVDVDCHQVRVLEGDKKYYFSHLTWQEKFAAIRLIFFCELDEFERVAYQFAEHRWRVVVRFMFGLCHADLVKKLRPLFPRLSHDRISSKLASLRRRFFTDTPVDLPSSFHLCNIAVEANNDNILNEASEVLPESITLDGSIQARDIASFCHVLRKTERRVEVLFEIFSPQFHGNGLYILVETFNRMGWQLKHIRAQKTRIDDAEAEQISRQVPGLEDLRIWKSRVSDTAMITILDAVSRRTTKISTFTLTENPLSNEAVDKLADCVCKVVSLRLGLCQISGDKLGRFSQVVADIEQPITEIKMNGNPLGTNGALQMSLCLHKINKLSVNGCGIDGEGAEHFSRALLARNRRMHVLDLRDNKLGDRGAIALAEALVKVNQIFLKNCGISPVGVNAIKDKLEAGADQICTVEGLDIQ